MRVAAICYWIALLPAALLGLAGCALSPTPHNGSIVWPKPPAEPRLIYETTLRSAEDLNPTKREDQLRRIMGGDPAVEQSLLRKPFDIAARKGLIAVSDTVQGLVHVFDVPRRRVFAFGWRGQGELAKPLGLAIDDERNIYVADGGRNIVAVFNRFGHFLHYIGSADQFSRLVDVAVSPDGQRIYTLDRGGVDSDLHRVGIYNAQGELLKHFAARGQEAGLLNHPSQIALDGEDVLVLDAGNFRIQRFDAEGSYLDSWGQIGRNMGQFARPRGMAVDTAGHVYVSDSAFQNFQIFDRQGRFLLAVGPEKENSPGHYVLPVGMATDETGRIYIVDQYLSKVDVLRLLTERERQNRQ